MREIIQSKSPGRPAVLFAGTTPKKFKYGYDVLRANGTIVCTERSYERAVESIATGAARVVVGFTSGEAPPARLAELIQDNPRCFGASLIAVVDPDTITRRVRTLQRGAADVVGHSVTPEELLARVQTQIERQMQLLTLRARASETSTSLSRVHEEMRELKIELSEKQAQNDRLTRHLIAGLEKVNAAKYENQVERLSRVSHVSAELARRYGKDESWVERITRFAPLHDIGNVRLADSLLRKTGRYTLGERRQMEQHVRYGAELLEGADLDPMAANIVRYHHERWDGCGYLDGLSDLEIPLEARIVAIAASLDAILSMKSYQRRRHISAAIEEIAACRGTQFDPDLVEMLLFDAGELISHLYDERSVSA